MPSSTDSMLKYLTQFKSVDFDDRLSDFDLLHSKKKFPTNGAEIHMIFEQPINYHKLFVRGTILRKRQNLVSLC